MSKFPITLSRFIIEQQAAHPEATGEFSIFLDSNRVGRENDRP